LPGGIVVPGRAVGFYWTLPVPWAGFISLPENAAEAAMVSRTIRYQRVLVGRYARENSWELVNEVVFLEVQPDRASSYVREPVRRAAELCRAHQALLLSVDFAVLHGWRGHNPLREAAEDFGIELLPIAAESVELDGETFDPHEHFSLWRDRQRRWSAEKPSRRAAMLAKARQMRSDGLTYAGIAERLNDTGLPSPSGKPHTSESVRKVLQGDAS
jgi:hypothetical protein